MKNRPLILFILITWLASSCNALNEEAPSNLISPNKMARILVDIHEVEMQVSRLGLGSYDSSMVAYKYLELEVLESFEVDSSQYRQSYEYYAAKPVEFMRIYEDIESILEEKDKKEEDHGQG